MTECQTCTAPAELWICPLCIDELRAALMSLVFGPSGNRPTPGLLSDLNDVVTRQTCMGSSHGHRKRGDEMPALFAPDTEKGRATRQGQAGKLMNEARNTLTTIVRDVCETRGLDVWIAFHPKEYGNGAQMAARDFIGPLLPGWRRVPAWQPTPPEIAHWLAIHVHALACSEDAGQWKREIDALVRKIKRAVDRPPAPKLCGQCDHMNDDRKICGLMLRAHPDAIEVTCPLCHTVHNIEALYNRWRNYVDYQIVSRETLIGNQRAANPELYNTGIMGALDEFVHWQAFNRWVRERHLKPVRYMRPNGRRGFFRHGPEDIPEYRVGDVRRVKRKMEQAQGKAKANA